jgi:hypothetical protein
MAAASDSLVIPEDAFLPPNESKREWIWTWTHKKLTGSLLSVTDSAQLEKRQGTKKSDTTLLTISDYGE